MDGRDKPGHDSHWLRVESEFTSFARVFVSPDSRAQAGNGVAGASLLGALGSAHGPLVGSFFPTTTDNGANLLNLNPFWRRIVTGAPIVIVVYFGALRRRKR